MAAEFNVEGVARQGKDCMEALLDIAKLRPGDIVVVGCSTSEIIGERIGSASNEDVAGALFGALYAPCAVRGIYLAVQCCEHLNRALVVQRECAERYGLEQVNALPHVKAGGALSTAAMSQMPDSILVESIEAHAGMDIGDTLIGMHLKRVAVPVRTNKDSIGYARVVMARTRHKYIGGPRTHYEND